MFRSSMLLLSLLCLPVIGFAGPNAGGSLIIHANRALSYTDGNTGYCAQSALASCDEAVVTVPANSDSTVVFYVLASFPENSSPRLLGLTYGIQYNSALISLDDYGVCAEHELAMDTWPASGSGTSVVWDAAQTATLTEVYWFAAHTYAKVSSATFALTAHPDQDGLFGDDSVPAQLDEIAAYGELGFGTQGLQACGEVDGPSGPAGGQSESPSGSGEGDGPSIPESLTFVELGTTSDSAFVAETRAIRDEYGLSVLLGMTPDGFLCRASETTRAALNNDARVSLATNEAISGVPTVEEEDLEPGDSGFAARIWNSMLSAPPDTASGTMAPSDSCIYYGDLPDRARPLWGAENQTSVYMLGDIGVSLLLMESEQTGECVGPNYPEDWTTAERNKSYYEVAEGLGNLARLALPYDRVTYWMAETSVLSTSIEPIQHNHTDSTWVSEAMNDLGFTSGNYVTRMRSLCNARRAEPQFAFDWWLITFMIRDVCDSDRRFSDGAIAFGSYYGPRMTLPYKNGYIYSENELDDVARHEVCHLFGAADEYYATDCYAPWGYLRVPNTNDIDCNHTEPCTMYNCMDSTLCTYTRGQIGWMDSDEPPDYAYDPIDHPSSHMSALIGAADSLSPGDWVDISDSTGTWVKRLIASQWNEDGGRVLWDGIDYDGQPRPTGHYTWKRNGGTSHNTTLRGDTGAPVISDLVISPGSQALDPDTMSFRFVDSDTHGGRVRVIASPEFPGTDESRVIRSYFFRDTAGSPGPIRRLYSAPHDGLWTLTIQVWDVGDGHQAIEDSTYWHGDVSGVRDARPHMPEISLSSGRPNPSKEWIAWDLGIRQSSTLHLSIVGVDGRCLKSWGARQFPGGITRIVWDGVTTAGIRVSSGKYFLVAIDKHGHRAAMPATIIR